MKPVWFLWVVLLSTISVSIGFAQGSGDERTFKIVYQVSAKMPDGSQRYFGTRVRYGHRDGRFREISYDPEGNEVSFRLNAFAGQFLGRSSEQKLSSIGVFQTAAAGKQLTKILGKKASPKSHVLGYVTYRRKTADESAKIYSAQEFGPTPLKIVVHDRETSVTITQEALAVTWESVSEEIFSKPAWPVTPSGLESSLKGYEQSLLDGEIIQRSLGKQKSQ